MTLSFSFRRLPYVMALVMCSAAIVAFTSPASARPYHHAKRHVHGYHHFHSHNRHHGFRHHAGRSDRHAVGLRGPARDANASMPMQTAFGGSSGLVSEARRYIGGNPTGRGSLWCANFMNMVLERTGHRGSGSNMARSFASYGQRISGPQVGAIAVMSRGRRGGHVGVVSGIDSAGNPIVISGNHGNRVAEAVYSHGSVYAYVMPN